MGWIWLTGSGLEHRGEGTQVLRACPSHHHTALRQEESFAEEDHIIIPILLVGKLQAQRAKQLPHSHSGGLRAGPSPLTASCSLQETWCFGNESQSRNEKPQVRITRSSIKKHVRMNTPKYFSGSELIWLKKKKGGVVFRSKKEVKRCKKLLWIYNTR